MDVYEHIERIAREAHYEVMGSAGILGILANRETVSEDRLLALTADDMEPLYDMFIGPAIDRLESYLLREDDGPTENWEGHGDSATHEGGEQ